MDDNQFQAAVTLLKAQNKQIGEYWSDYTKEVQSFKAGNSVLGTSWQVIVNLGSTPTTSPTSTRCGTGPPRSPGASTGGRTSPARTTRPGCRPGPRSRADVSVLDRHPRLRLAALLSAPLLWLVVAYLGALAVLLMSAFWTVNGFTGQTVRQFSLANFRTIASEDVYRIVTLRSVGVAAAVTVVCCALAVPMAFFMAKVASSRSRHWLVIAILTPLWASYLVKAYAWRILLAHDGPLDTLLGGPGYGLPATVIVLAYLWLPT
jgi:hypothetical protein